MTRVWIPANQLESPGTRRFWDNVNRDIQNLNGLCGMDQTILGPGFEARGIRSPSADVRPWIQGFAQCAALEARRIAHAGVGRVTGPHRIHRARQTSNYFMVTLSGSVRVCLTRRFEKAVLGTCVDLPSRTAGSGSHRPARPAAAGHVAGSRGPPCHPGSAGINALRSVAGLAGGLG